jgi:uncharacterized protein YkwD
MLKKIFLYIVYGVIALCTIQYVFVGRVSPSTILSDIAYCFNNPDVCKTSNQLRDLKSVIPTLDSISFIESEKERQVLLSSFETDVVDLTNKERVARSLLPLVPQTLLADSAQIKALDMNKRQYFEHDSPEGRGVSDLAKSVEYDFLIVGENLALGDFKTPQDVVDAWMNSKGHRENILNARYSEIGVSMVSGTFNGRKALFIVQHFGTNRSICPIIDLRLKNNIDETTAILKGDEATIENLKDTIESTNNIFSPEYGKNVAVFNTLIENYNILLEKSRSQIAQYNKEVREFNECLADFQ